MLPRAHIEGATNSLSGVPTFDWSYGCSAMAGAMMAGYYDRNSYTNMYAGPTNGGVCPLDNTMWGTGIGGSQGQCPLSATRKNLDGLAKKGHVDDYYYNYGRNVDPYAGNWKHHTNADCTADFMGTSMWYRWENYDGSTRFYFYSNGAPLHDFTGAKPYYRDGTHGLRKFFESRGYTVITNYNQYIDNRGHTYGFTFAQYKAQIDAGHPVLIHVTNHTMLGIGYNDTGNLVYLHDTWDHSVHSMTWGGTYPYGIYDLQHFGVSVFELGPPPPSIPELSSPANGATVLGNSITFEWDASAGATNYRIQVIQVSDGSLFDRVPLDNVTSYTMNGFPQEGTEYMWQVRAGNNNGWSWYSDFRYFTNAEAIPPPTPALSSPADNATVAGSSITFKWNTSPGATEYRIQVKKASNMSLFNRLTVSDITSYAMSGFPEDDTEYVWQVRAGNVYGWSDYSTPSNFTNVSSPAVPTLSSPADSATVVGNSITFEWDVSAGATKYRIQVKKASDMSLFDRVILGDVTSYEMGGFPQDGTEYVWQVRAGNAYGWSDYSPLRSFTSSS